MRTLLGNEYENFIHSLTLPPPVSVRINDKINYQPSHVQVSWCESGYYLGERPVFTADPYFHAGVYYVQEASSMFLQTVVDQYLSQCTKVLDLCAAPGGKSTLLSNALQPDALLVSNEVIRGRANVLAENTMKWGSHNVLVTNNQPKDFASLGGFFDAIVVDAPCSGEGMFRKDKGAINEWSEQNVKMCASRQKDILAAVWDALKTDGILVYSTCTFNRAENEENVEWMCRELGAEYLTVDITDFDQICETDAGYRFYPHRVAGEGFFISVVKKTAKAPKPEKNKNKNSISALKNALPEYISLKEPEKWHYFQENNFIYALNKVNLESIFVLKNRLNCIYTGIEIGELKGKDIVPSESLALSKSIDTCKTIVYDMNLNEAIRYLKRETLTVDSIEKGYFLVVYNNIPIGWMKNVGNRCNNLYPSEWKIRMNL